MNDTTVILLREGSPPVPMTLQDGVAAEIVRLGIASVTPLGNGEWSVSGVSKVGVVRIGSTELRVEPKVPLSRLFFLLSRIFEWDAWRDEEVKLESADQLYPAIAELFARSAERVARAGIVSSYQEHRAAEAFVRGRWLVSEQIRKRHGMPLPAELSYDEFTPDIDENRMMRSAARRLLKVAGLRPSLRSRLYRIDALFDEAELLVGGRPLPNPTIDRRNEHYRSSLGLARLILEDASIDHGIADVSAAGFLLNMATLFERFIEVEVARAAHKHGGIIQPQRRDYLDQDLQIVVKPDLVWVHEGVVSAVFDAKYKAEKFGGYPNADIYQMLAYCVRHGVNEGHLVYAAGNEVPSRFLIEQSGTTVICHAIHLDSSPERLMRQIDLIVDGAIGTGSAL